MAQRTGATALFVALAFLAAFAPHAAAVSLRAASGDSNGTGATTLVLGTPAGVVQNDLMLAQVTVRGGTDTDITPPAGWSLVLRTDSGSALAQAVYSKVADAAEPASHTWTFSQSRKASGGIAAYAGVDSASPIDASAGQANPSSASVTAPSITTTAPNTMLVGFFGSAKGTTFTPPSGMTERYDVASTGGGIGSQTASEAADETSAAAGATGTRSATAVDSAENIGQLVALRPPSVAFSSASSSGSEASTSVTITVSLSGASSLATTVDYTVGGTATGGGVDHALAAGTVTFAAGSTSQDIAFTVSNDALDEADETVVVTLANPGNANLGSTTSHTYTITDDDPAPTVTLGLSGSPMAEAAGSATVTATLSQVSGQDVTVDLAFSGTATLTDDYTRSGTSIMIPAGATTGTVTLTAVQDALDEADETIIVDIDTVTNGAESGTQQVTATITDDDPPPGGGGGGGIPYADLGSCAPQGCLDGFDVSPSLSLTPEGLAATLTWPHHDWPSVFGYALWRDEAGEEGGWTLLATLYEREFFYDPFVAFADPDASAGTRYKVTFFTGHTPERGFPDDQGRPEGIPGWEANVFATVPSSEPPAEPRPGTPLEPAAPEQAPTRPPETPPQAPGGGATAGVGVLIALLALAVLATLLALRPPLRADRRPRGVPAAMAGVWTATPSHVHRAIVRAVNAAAINAGRGSPITPIELATWEAESKTGDVWHHVFPRFLSAASVKPAPSGSRVPVA